MKVKCKECNWNGLDRDLLIEDHPFDPQPIAGCRNKIYGCPECLHAAEGFITLCETEGCLLDASCGTPTKNGYKTTCYQHAPKDDL